MSKNRVPRKILKRVRFLVECYEKNCLFYSYTATENISFKTIVALGPKAIGAILKIARERETPPSWMIELIQSIAQTHQLPFYTKPALQELFNRYYKCENGTQKEINQTLVRLLSDWAGQNGFLKYKQKPKFYDLY